jgi:asparagine synthase (glutamine-hydrolysing)
MCGICGIWNLGAGEPVNRDALGRVCASIRHRGPDDSGVYFDDRHGLGLGFQRLSIIDLTAAGHQPMCNEDRSVWLVFNGEIYNFAELRDELEKCGHVFRSRTDSETVLHGYEQWGLDVVLHLRGMFAFAVWDAAARRLVLARDRIGIKPLFYSLDRDRIVFASELKAILALPGFDRALDHGALNDYLTYNYIPAPRTAYRHVSKLPAAHLLVVEDAGRLVQYWDIDLEKQMPICEEEAVESVRDGLRTAVNSHLVADVPVGVFLSGGMDSSTIAVLMTDARKQPIETFSVGFDVRESSELPWAREVANQIGSHHHEQVLTWPDAQAQLNQVVSTYDEPFADTSSVPTMAVSRLARQQVTVALSGEGGDEIFAGYDTYTMWSARERFHRAVPQWAGLPLEFVGERWPLARGQRFARFLAATGQEPLEQFARLMEWITVEEKRALVPDERLREMKGHDDRWAFRRYWRDDVDPITRVQYLDLKTYLADDLLVKVDRASMAVSLEARVPMLDHPLVEKLFAIPSRWRFKGGRTKYLERAAMADRLPPGTLTRRKMGFTPPMHQWLSRSNSAWAREMLQNGAAVELGLIRRDAIDCLDPVPAWLWPSKVWVLLVLEAWSRRECGWPQATPQ